MNLYECPECGRLFLETDLWLPKRFKEVTGKDFKNWCPNCIKKRPPKTVMLMEVQNNMIEMTYSKNRMKPIILNSGVYKNHKYIVLNLGTHPTAYVECKFDDADDYDDSRFINIEVHWALTYFGNDYWNEKHDGNNYIGWDYAHAYDWVGYDSDEDNERLNNNKHTTQEMTNECFSVIDQLVEIEKEYKKEKLYTSQEVYNWLEEQKVGLTLDEDTECINWLEQEWMNKEN